MASLVGPGEPLSYTANMRLIPLLIAFLVFLGAGGAPNRAAASELELYAFPTEGGTVAMRQLRDANGVVFQILYYTLDPVRRDLQANPPAEHELIVQTVDLFTYDGAGQLIRTETMDGSGAPLRDLFTVYGEDGLLRAEITCTGPGVRRQEKRYDTSEGVSIVRSVLTFDHTGEKLMSFNGQLPEGLDLAGGWGPTDDVLACGAVAYEPAAPLEDQIVKVTVRNLGAELAQVATGPAYGLIEPELRDEAGVPVEPDPKVAQEFVASVAALSGESAVKQQPVPPGHGWTVAAFELIQWYPTLAPGLYTLSLRYGATDGLIGVLCNEIELDVPVDRNTPNVNERGR